MVVFIEMLGSVNHETLQILFIYAYLEEAWKEHFLFLGNNIF